MLIAASLVALGAPAIAPEATATVGFLYSQARSASASDSGLTTSVNTEVGGLFLVGASGCAFHGTGSAAVHGTGPSLPYEWSAMSEGGSGSGPIAEQALESVVGAIDPEQWREFTASGSIVMTLLPHPIDEDDYLDEAHATARLPLFCPVPGQTPPEDCDLLFNAGSPPFVPPVLQGIAWLCPIGE